jgi:hypothetical protein
VAGPVLYSTNPQIAHHISIEYRGGVHVVWVSEHFDPLAAASSSPAALVGRSSSPRDIFDELARDCDAEDSHSPHLKRYRKKFRSLTRAWQVSGELTDEQFAEIESLLKPGSWTIWRPLLYVIPRGLIEHAGRLGAVPPAKRASHGPEYQITDLRRDEFDILRWVPR